MNEKAKRYIRAARKWIIDAMRGLYPFFICWMGGGLLFISGNDEPGLARGVGFAIAGLSWFWALDLAAARAEAKAKSETAAAIVSQLTNGNDTEISVSFSGGTGTLGLKSTI